MKAIVYTRYRVKEYYHYLSERVFGTGNIAYFSDDKYCENHYIMIKFYRVLKSIDNGSMNPPELSESLINEIILRCRYLRDFDRIKAKSMVNSMWIVLGELLEREKPEVAFGLLVDSYVLDIFSRLCEKRGIRYITLAPLVLNGYTRFTCRGELIKLREPSKEEVDRVYRLLLGKKYLPWYVKSGTRSSTEIFFKYYIKDKIKKLLFSVLRHITRDPLNFYYGSHLLHSPMMLCDNVSNIFPHKYFDFNWEEKIRSKNNLPIVYLPLQFYPECSTDYWTIYSEMISFYKIFFNTIDILKGKAIVITKEHPVSLGYRSVSVYKEILKRENTILVPDSVPSLQLIELSDVIITWGTSTAIEARIRNKHVITYGLPYYDDGNSFIVIDSIRDIQKLPDIIDKAVRETSLYDGRKIVRNLLSSSFEANFYPVDFNVNNKKQKENADLIAEAMNKYLNVIMGK